MGMGMARVVRQAPPPKMLELVANPGYLFTTCTSALLLAACLTV